MEVENILSDFLTVLGWRNVISGDEGECFCSYLSTCSGLNRFLMALSVIIGTLKEHDLRLVTNLTKLRPVSSRTQQVLALWLMAIMLGLPQATARVTREDVGSSWRLSRSQPPTLGLCGVEGRGHNNPGSIKVWLMPFFLGLMTGYLAYGSLGQDRQTDRPTAGCSPSRSWPSDTDLTVESTLLPN